MSGASDQCERTSKRTSKWPSASVCIPGYSGPKCITTNIFVIGGGEGGRTDQEGGKEAFLQADLLFEFCSEVTFFSFFVFR